MRPRLLTLAISCLLAGSLAGCNRGAEAPAAAARRLRPPRRRRSPTPPAPGDYVSVPLTADLSAFDDTGQADARAAGPGLRRDELAVLAAVWRATATACWPRPPTPPRARLVELNYGPWDRLNDDTPFVDGIGARPPGANFYPADMTKEEFEAADLADKTSWYTLLRRDAAGKLITVPYHVAYKADLEKAAALLRQAAPLSKDTSLRQLPDDARRRAAVRRLPAQRPGLDGHEDQPGGHRHRPDRDLRGPAVRLQGQLRRPGADQGHGLERAAWRASPSSCRSCSAACRCRQVQGRSARLGRRPQRLRRDLLRRQRQRRRQDHRHQPAQRRAGAAEERHAPAAAGKRHAGEVRQHPGADRQGAHRRGPAEERHLRCLLRGHHVP